MKSKKTTSRIPFRKGDIFLHEGVRYVYFRSSRDNIGVPMYEVREENTGKWQLWCVAHMKAGLEAGTIVKAK